MYLNCPYKPSYREVTEFEISHEFFDSSGPLRVKLYTNLWCISSGQTAECDSSINIMIELTR